ncbi:hypothetical protein KSZ_29710 [Dictyobacter formicarum]|uniref:Uncharacterized protein n=1 Tax=Dictyobacter formicarum TaxID=2778368 RepID=A0ABQ3VFL6_9CHLR|nr:hypothetical protein KSZ_29710 [Dictyobacter formicarum]
MGRKRSYLEAENFTKTEEVKYINNEKCDMCIIMSFFKAISTRMFIQEKYDNYVQRRTADDGKQTGGLINHK